METATRSALPEPPARAQDQGRSPAAGRAAAAAERGPSAALAFSRHAGIDRAPRVQLQRQLIAQLFGAGAAPAAALQRYPDPDDGMLADAEKPTLDEFLVENWGDHVYYSAAAYGAMAVLYATLLQNEGNTDTVEAAWDAVDQAAAAAHLVAGNPPWTAAVDLGANAYEANPAADYPAAAAATWPGRVAVYPPAFEVAVQNQVAARAAARLLAIDNAYTAYTDNERLLPGTVIQIKAQLLQEHPGGANLVAVNARLALVYQRQCTVSRENWLTHLGIAGGNLKGAAQPNLHYTTFNNSVPNPLVLRVDLLTVPQLLAGLFTVVATDLQIHATRQIGQTRYHRYFNGVFNFADPQDVPLNNEYDRMHREMTEGVTRAKAAHGRVAANDRGQQLAVGA